MTDHLTDPTEGLSRPILTTLINHRGLNTKQAVKLCQTMQLREPIAKDRQAMGHQKQRARAADEGCIVIPYWSIEKRELEAALRIRMADGVEPKYVGSAGVPPHAYFYPGVDWQAVSKDASVEIVVTEGEFSAAIACELGGYACIAIAGVWSFKSKKAGYSFLPELERFDWQNRSVVIIYDSDASEKKGVRAALFAMAQELRKRGVKVRSKSLPSEPTGEKNGVDDYLVRHGKQALDDIPAVEFERDTIMDALRRRYRKVETPIGVWDSEADNGEGCGLGAIRTVHDFYALTDDCQFEETSPSGNVIKIHGGKAFRESKDSPSALGIRFDPSFTVDENIYINLAKPMPDEAIKDEAIINNYWKPLVTNACNGNASLIRHTEQWFAAIIKFPGVKLHYGIGISGPQGYGKSLLGVVGGSPLHPEHFNEINGSLLFDPFNDVCARKQLIVANEISRTDKKHYLTHLKTMITQANIRINGKYQVPFVIRDTINYVLTSNDDDFLWLDDDDRRWLILSVENKLDHDLGKAIYFLFKGTSAESRAARSALRWYFENAVDMAAFDAQGRAPDTDAKHQLRINTLPPLDKFVRDVADMVIADAAKRGRPSALDLQSTKYLTEKFRSEAGSSVSVQQLAQQLAGALRRDKRWKFVTTNDTRPRIKGELLTIVTPVNADYWLKELQNGGSVVRDDILLTEYGADALKADIEDRNSKINAHLGEKQAA
jgi:hypothetical protein